MKNFKEQLFSAIKPVQPVLEALVAAGAVPYLVGGCVRDLVLEQPLKDLDIEVHGLPLEKVEAALRAFGLVMLVGKQFGVLRLAAYDADWSLPRTDSLGRKPTVALDPHLGIMAACKRRDLTMNAMAVDLRQLLQEGDAAIIDHYGGRDAIAARELRAVDEELFVQDPLRFFRVMQFVGRFEMDPEPALDALCRRMALHDVVTSAPLALERIAEEVKKLCTKAVRPSLGFRWLARIGRLGELFPELDATRDTPQRADYHPEGSVFEHAMQATDAAARFKREGLARDQAEHFLLVLGALCHDLGKAVTTTADLKAHGHDKAGVPLAEALLRRLSNDQHLAKQVCVLVRHHLAPFTFLEQGSTLKAYKRLAAKLGNTVSMRQLGLVALADRQGRNGQGHEPLLTSCDLYAGFLERCAAAAVTEGPEAPVLLGRHLLDAVSAGPELGRLLTRAYELQLDEGITDPAILRQRVLKKRA